MTKRPEERFFAVIENGVVTNLIVGVEDEVVAANSNKYIEYVIENSPRIGWTYNGKTFTDPDSIEAPTTPVK